MLPGGYLRAAAPFVLVLLVLAGAFATRQAHIESSKAPSDAAARAMAGSGESAIPSMTSMPAISEHPRSDNLPLSNGADGEEDGTGDVSEMLAMVAFWFLLFLDGGLLLTFWNGPAKLASICCPASERPG
jgi:hypothetical protein